MTPTLITRAIEREVISREPIEKTGVVMLILLSKSFTRRVIENRVDMRSGSATTSTNLMIVFISISLLLSRIDAIYVRAVSPPLYIMITASPAMGSTLIAIEVPRSREPKKIEITHTDHLTLISEYIMNIAPNTARADEISFIGSHHFS